MKRWGRVIGPIYFSVYFDLMQACSFSTTSEFTGSYIKAKCEPMKKYKGACEKDMSKPMKSPYGVGGYCDMAVPPTRSHFLWLGLTTLLYEMPSNLKGKNFV